MEVADECRKAFEAHCKDTEVYIGRHHKLPDQYQLYETQLRWMGFQAAWNARATPEAPAAGQPDDRWLINQMLIACEGLDDLEDCMSAALEAIKLYTRQPKQQPSTLTKEEKREAVELMTANIFGMAMSKKRGVAEACFSALLEKYEIRRRHG